MAGSAFNSYLSVNSGPLGSRPRIGLPRLAHPISDSLQRGWIGIRVAVTQRSSGISTFQSRWQRTTSVEDATIRHSSKLLTSHGVRLQCHNAPCGDAQALRILARAQYQFNLKGLLIFITFAALIAMASSNGGTWFHIGEAVATVIILAGVAGLLTGNRSRAR
jgi:hypothetical protein